MRKILTVILTVLLISGLVSCSGEKIEEDLTVEHLGNANGNMFASGLAVSRGEDIYYSWVEAENSMDPYLLEKLRLYRMSPDGSAVPVDADCVPTYLNNYEDEWLFYIDAMDRCIYKMRFDGTEKEKIADTECDSMLLRNDRIYYTVSKTGPVYDLYSMDLDGARTRKITQIFNSLFQIENGKLYYVKQDSAIYRCDLDGSGEETVAEDVGVKFQVSDGTIYAIIPRPEHFDSGRQNQLVKISADGTRTTVVPELSTNFTVHEDKIYYLRVNDEDQMTLYSSALDGTNISEVAAGPWEYYSSLATANDTVGIMSVMYMKWIKI